jgi:hypothetical protein
MSVCDTLKDRIDAEFSAADERIKQFKGAQVQAFQERVERRNQLGTLYEELREIWRPRLEALQQKFGERVNVKPNIEPGQRSATFDVQSELARIKLRFGVAPDADVRTVTFTYDLEVIPILMKFDSHDEIEFPLDRVDKAALGKWFEDRIVSFVKTYVAIHENQYYLKDHLVEDPIAKVRFPKFAAGATLDVGGRTHYFIDDSTLKQFKEKAASK